MTDQQVLWVWAHPDDEIIAAGLSLRQHLEAARDCYVLTLTRGTASGVRDFLNGAGVDFTWGMAHDPTAEGYAPLSPADFGAARYAETRGALTILASGTGRTVTMLEGGLQDGAVAKADVMTAIADVYASICAPGETLWLKTHTDLLASGGTPLENPDHTAAAQAVRQLSVDQPTIFGNVRFYVEPEHWADSVVVAKHPTSIKPATGTHQSAATLNAYEPFRAWVPDAGRFAIGRQSVATLFVTPPENRYHA